MENKVTKFLDTTIRDGGYAINFQFSVSDVIRIVSCLEEVGYEYIEIGHGMGLNGSSPKNGIALHNDLDYMKAANKTLKRAKYGMFCIPGIAQISDLELAYDNGMGFVRVGENVNRVKNMESYIRKAKQLGMMVMANFMKSYAVSVEEFGEKVKWVEEYGADVVYIVDSAGSMFPEDVKKYIDIIRKNTNLKIGFHGHNNLGMAVANTLAAYEEKIEFVDTTMQGMGRSAGNAAAELVLASLMKKGYTIDIDVFRLMMKSKALIQPLLHKRGINPLDVVSGYSEFHSSYMKSIHRVSTQYNVNPLELIIEYTKQDKFNMDESLLQDIAEKMPETTIASIDLDFWEYF